MVPVLVAKAIMSYEEVLEEIMAVRREMDGKREASKLRSSGMTPTR